MSNLTKRIHNYNCKNRLHIISKVNSTSINHKKPEPYMAPVYPTLLFTGN